MVMFHSFLYVYQRVQVPRNSPVQLWWPWQPRVAPLALSRWGPPGEPSKLWIYPLVMTNIAMGNDPFIDGLPIKNGDFSMAMLNYQRVNCIKMLVWNCVDYQTWSCSMDFQPPRRHLGILERPIRWRVRLCKIGFVWTSRNTPQLPHS